MDKACYTNPGGREKNEDSYLIADDAYVVCDGLGGHESGEIASDCAVKYMSKLCRDDPPYSNELIEVFYMRTNKAVYALEEKALTTMVGGFIRDGIFYYQGVGDSRLYYFRNGRKYAQTRDDSVCQEAVDHGTLDYNDIRTSEDRSSLLKVLGNERDLRVRQRYDPILIQEKDAFLVCSDGFWEHVVDEEMEKTLRESESAADWMDRMLRIHYARAGNRDDNYTVICCIADQTDVMHGVDPSGITMTAEIPMSKAELLHDNVETEDFESMPVKEVEFDPLDTDDEEAVTGGTGTIDYHEPYFNEGRRGDVTERIPDLSGEHESDGEKRGFLTSLFRKR